jgi:hypothetical protein
MKVTRTVLLVLLGSMIYLSMVPVLAKSKADPEVSPPQSRPHGKSYAEWTVLWWQWLMGHPFVPGHPSFPDPTYDISANQTGRVWFLAAALGTSERSGVVPAGTWLFVSGPSVESSSIEVGDFHGDTEDEQRAIANFFADHIVDPFCTVDGVAVQNIEDHRIDSPQFTFTAADPWIFGPGGEGQTGTSVGDGYFFMIRPLSKGEHTIHVGGTFLFTLEDDGFDLELPADATFHVTVE